MSDDVAHILTILAVERLGECLEFYRRAFPWELKVETPMYAEFLLPGGMRLGLYKREGFGRSAGGLPFQAPAGALLPTELYLRALDLEAAVARLESAGARRLPALAPRAWGDEVVYFADPAGNVLALARPLGGA